MYAWRWATTRPAGVVGGEEADSQRGDLMAHVQTVSLGGDQPGAPEGGGVLGGGRRCDAEPHRQVGGAGDAIINGAQRPGTTTSNQGN